MKVANCFAFYCTNTFKKQIYYLFSFTVNKSTTFNEYIEHVFK